jgi:hypothetical protein
LVSLNEHALAPGKQVTINEDTTITVPVLINDSAKADVLTIFPPRDGGSTMTDEASHIVGIAPLSCCYEPERRPEMMCRSGCPRNPGRALDTQSFRVRLLDKESGTIRG